MEPFQRSARRAACATGHAAGTQRPGEASGSVARELCPATPQEATATSDTAPSDQNSLGICLWGNALGSRRPISKAPSGRDNAANAGRGHRFCESPPAFRRIASRSACEQLCPSPSPAIAPLGLFTSYSQAPKPLTPSRISITSYNICRIKSETRKQVQG